jgi:uncharacterized protein (TIGR03084 family)
VRPELADLVAEHAAFAGLVSTLTAHQWALPSAADGWTVGDQVAHLADTEEVAADTLSGGPRAFATAVGGFGSAAEFTESGCRRGRALSRHAVVEWWRRAAAVTVSRLDSADPAARVPWGVGMSAEVFATARQMEHWAHGLDILDVLGRTVEEPDRLWRVAELGLATLPYAFAIARVRRPPGHTLRLVLTDRAGTTRVLGPPEATDQVEGGLLDWCRVAVRRHRGGPALGTTGPLAALAVRHARAYL